MPHGLTYMWNQTHRTRAGEAWGEEEMLVKGYRISVLQDE